MTKPLPPGWGLTAVGDVFKIVGGSTPRTDNPRYWDGDISWITPDDLSRHQGAFISKGRRSITTVGLESTSTQMLPQDSVLFSSRAPIGYVAIAANSLCTNQGFKSLIPPVGIQPKYVYWYLRYATPTIQDMGSGTTFKEISKKRMAVVPFLLPPTNEQERIVAAIEEHFSRIDAAESAAQTALARLKILRRAILTTAFSGHLVEPINPRRTPDGLPEDWQWITIGDLGNEVKGQITPHPGVIYDLYSVPAFPTGIPERIDGFDIKSGKREVEPYDVLLCKINPRINRVWMVENYSGQKQISSTEYFVLRLFDTRQAPYIKWYLSSPQFREWMGLSVEGGTGSHTRAKSGPIREQSVPIAPPEDRIQIVSAIEEQFSRIDAAKASLERCLQRCNAMRRSVLAAAFSGQLVEQYPDDEPASVLLERIAAERLKRRTRRKPA